MSALAWAESHPYQVGGGVFAAGVVLFLALRSGGSKAAPVVQSPGVPGYNAAAVAANQQLQGMQIAGQVKADGYATALKVEMSRNATQIAMGDIARLNNQDNIAASNALAITQTQAAISLSGISAGVANHKVDTQLTALQYQGAIAAAHDGNTYAIDMLQADVQKDKIAQDHNNVIENNALQTYRITQDHNNLVENNALESYRIAQDHNNVIENNTAASQQAMYRMQTAQYVALQQNQSNEYVAGQQSTAAIETAKYRAASANSASKTSSNNSDNQLMSDVASGAMMALMLL